MGVLRKKLKHTVIQKYYFLDILINVKAGRVNEGARKVYHWRRVGQACPRVKWAELEAISLDGVELTVSQERRYQYFFSKL
jgi:hypothetical protein